METLEQDVQTGYTAFIIESFQNLSGQSPE